MRSSKLLLLLLMLLLLLLLTCSPLLQPLQERELQAAVQSSTVDQLKTEVSALQAEKVELDSKQRRLDKEMETLNTHTSTCTQLDMLKKEKVRNEEDILFLPAWNSVQSFKFS